MSSTSGAESSSRTGNGNSVANSSSNNTNTRSRGYTSNNNNNSGGNAGGNTPQYNDYNQDDEDRLGRSSPGAHLDVDEDLHDYYDDGIPSRTKRGHGAVDSDDGHHGQRSNAGSSTRSDESKRLRYDYENKNTGKKEQSENHSASSTSVSAAPTPHVPPSSLSGGSGSSSGKAIALRCIFSHSDSGVVIGRKGANIISIRSNTKAQIDMVSNPNKQDLCDRILVINGTSSDVGDVAFHLGNLFLEAYANNESKEAPLSIMIPKPSQNQPAADLSPMFTLRVLVPTKCCGALIGRGGERVTEIRNRSNCIISTSDQPLPNSQERVLMISGKPEGVMDAVTQVCDILSSDSQINDYRTCMVYRPLPGIGSIIPSVELGSKRGQTSNMSRGPPGSYPQQQQQQQQQYGQYMPYPPYPQAYPPHNMPRGPYGAGGMPRPPRGQPGHSANSPNPMRAPNAPPNAGAGGQPAYGMGGNLPFNAPGSAAGANPAAGGAASASPSGGAGLAVPAGAAGFTFRPPGAAPGAPGAQQGYPPYGMGYPMYGPGVYNPAAAMNMYGQYGAYDPNSAAYGNPPQQHYGGGSGGGGSGGAGGSGGGGGNAPGGERQVRRGRAPLMGPQPGSPEAVSMRSQSEVVTNPDGSCTKHITLAYGEAGAIIGKGGNHVNEIKAQSGANLQFNETSPGAVTRVVTISGTPDAVASASFMVFNKLDMLVANFN